MQVSMGGDTKARSSPSPSVDITKLLGSRSIPIHAGCLTECSRGRGLLHDVPLCNIILGILTFDGNINLLFNSHP
jgi:hypothetical protein